MIRQGRLGDHRRPRRHDLRRRQPLTVNPLYDLLKNTTGVEAICREIALSIIQGADGRTLVVYDIGE